MTITDSEPLTPTPEELEAMFPPDNITPEAAPTTEELTYVAHGLGVIATGEGGKWSKGKYKEAGPITDYIPPHEDYTGKSSELLQYRRFNPNWAAAIAMRTKWQIQHDGLPSNIVLGEN